MGNGKRDGSPWRSKVSALEVPLYREVDDGELELLATVNVERDGRDIYLTVEPEAVDQEGRVVPLTDAEMERAQEKAVEEAQDDGGGW